MSSTGHFATTDTSVLLPFLLVGFLGQRKENARN
jgi:hypothetical protein